MEISKSTREVLVQAQMLKLKSQCDTLYAEHILYGLVLLARYLDEPLNNKEYLSEAKKLRKLLEKQIKSIAAAEKNLREKAFQDTAAFHDGSPVLGRAAELAGEKPITSLELAKAVLEKTTATVEWLNSLKILPSAEEDDARYTPKKANKKNSPDNNATVLDVSGLDISEAMPDPNRTVLDASYDLTNEKDRHDEAIRKQNEEIRHRIEEEEQRREREEQRKLEEDRLKLLKLIEEQKRMKEATQEEDRRKRAEEARKRKEEEDRRKREEERRKRAEEERKRKEEEERKKREEDARRQREEEARKVREKIERKKREEEAELERLKAIGLLAALEEYARDQKPQKPKRTRNKWTFIGPFEFKGDTFWGFLQYFLWGVVVSCGALFALQHFTHYVTNPPTAWWAFGINAFIVISVYYHLRGITYLMERKWPAWALFTRQIFDVILILGLMSAYVFEFSVPGNFPEWRKYMTGGFLTFRKSPLPYVPRWLKYTAGVLCVLVFSIGTIIYNSCYYGPADSKKTITHGRFDGPVGKVIFQSVSYNLVFPVALLFSIWAYNKPFKTWHVKVFWLYGFVFAWTMLFTIFMCWEAAVHSKWYRGKLFNPVRFITRIHIFMFIPELVIYLHWLFGWFPMQLWVKIVLGVYSVIGLIISVISAWLMVRN